MGHVERNRAVDRSSATDGGPADVAGADGWCRRPAGPGVAATRLCDVHASAMNGTLVVA